MLPTHEYIEEHHGFTVYRRKPGFEFTPMTLGKIASFLIVGPKGTVAVAAFFYSMLDALENGDGNDVMDEAFLLEEARQQVEDEIARGSAHHRADLTFEWRTGAWTAIAAPRWWISVFVEEQ